MQQEQQGFNPETVLSPIRGDSFYIAKSPSLYATVDQIEFVKTDPTDQTQIIAHIFQPVNENEFTTVIPFVSDALPERTGEYLDFRGVVLPLVLEFDNCSTEFQEERVKFMADEIRTPMIAVNSGNKSIHHYFLFQNFADSKEEYTRMAKQFVAYLAHNYPQYYQEQGGSDQALIPDYRMFTGNRYTRQANGRRSDGTLQRGILINPITDGYEPLNLGELVGDIQPAKGKVSFSATSTWNGDEKRDPRKATYRFIAMGVDKGNRDNECFQAACDLRDCDYTQEEAIEKLMEGARRCNPPFPEQDVRVKVHSAWRGDNHYNPVNPHRPWAFIEATTGTYYYLLEEKIYHAPKDILKETFKSLKETLPEEFPILEFKYDVHDNHQVDLGNRKLNLFRPTPYMLMKPDGRNLDPATDFPTINRLLVNLFTNDDEREHFLNWLATILQTRGKMITSFVLLGVQGAGKGLLLRFVLKPLFGEDQAIQVEDEQLKSQFNGWIKNVFFIAFNEVAHDNPGRNALNSKIKAIITDPTITVNEKSIKTYEITNSVNCVFFSNEAVPLLVERTDRRFTIIRTGAALTTQDWFEPLVTFPSFKKELPAFAQYLWNYRIDERKANTVLENDVKQNMIDSGMSRFEEFAHHLKLGDVDWLWENMQQDSFDPVVQEELNAIKNNSIEKDLALKVFNRIYPAHPVSPVALSKHLKHYGIEPDRWQIGGTRMRIYKWST